jgi:hypothetical protein
VVKSGDKVASIDDRKKAEQIEKLAKSVRAKMKQSFEPSTDHRRLALRDSGQHPSRQSKTPPDSPDGVRFWRRLAIP